MKRVIICLFAFVVPLFSCDDDDYPNAEIPSVVLNEFRLEFPEAKDMDWGEKIIGYEVDFELGRVDHTALINPEGHLLRVKKEISMTELPPVINGSLQQHFEKEDVDDIEMVTTKKATYYQFKIDNLILDDKIIMDNSGKINTTNLFWD